MSIEAATAFKTLVMEDAGLQAEVLAAAESGGIEAVCALAAGRGYAFTPADAEAALAPAGGEMSDLELEAVAGGKKRNTNASAAASSVPIFNVGSANPVGAAVSIIRLFGS